jgi:site-specific DNA recombinase
MDALIYTRVSQDPKKLGRSVEQQEAECRAVCERNGWTVAEVVSDNDRSASRHAKQSRPGWERVLERLTDVDVLVCWESSRSTRDLAAYVELRDACMAAGVLMSFSGTTYDISTTDDRFRTGLDALLAEQESDRTRDRILRAVRSNAARGRPHGRRLFGYRRTYDSATGALLGQELDPVEAPLVADAARRVLSGEPGARIAKEWNAAGITTAAGARWDVTKMKRLLTNPSYTALRVHQGEIVGPGDWPAIIDRDTFDQLASLYSDPARARFKSGDTKHLLSGVAVCGRCGARMYRGHDRGRGVYVCREGSQHLVRSQEHLDAYVTAIVVGLLERADLDLTPSSDPAVVEAREEAVLLRHRLADAVAEFTAGNLTAATLAHIEGDLLPQIDGAERRARAAITSPVLIDVVGPHASDAWDALSVEQRRAVVAEMVTVVVKPSNRVRGSRGFNPDDVDVRPI